MFVTDFSFRNPDLPLEQRVADLVSRLTLDEKIDLMCQYQEAIPRLGIAKYKHGTEAAHGIAWLGEATVFPQPFGLACTWDEELLQKVGRVIGTEARGFFARDPALHGLTLWAPTVDLLRDPRWGRTDEGYGEDPVHAGKMAAALVRGIQGITLFTCARSRLQSILSATTTRSAAANAPSVSIPATCGSLT